MTAACVCLDIQPTESSVGRLFLELSGETAGRSPQLWGERGNRRPRLCRTAAHVRGGVALRGKPPFLSSPHGGESFKLMRVTPTSGAARSTAGCRGGRCG